MVIQGSKDGYPELEEKKEFIFKVLTNEENQFNKTIDQGLRILSDMEDAMKEKGEKILSGDDAFMILMDSRWILPKRFWRKKDTVSTKKALKRLWTNSVPKQEKPGK